MALLGFKDRFVPAIERGDKRHTIRGFRADIKVGTRLDLYARPRQKGMRLIFRAPCVGIEEIEINHRREGWTNPDTGYFEEEDWHDVRINDHRLVGNEKESLALKDGFTSFADMMGFWEGRLPFEGQIIYWDYGKRSARKVAA